MEKQTTAGCAKSISLRVTVMSALESCYYGPCWFFFEINEEWAFRDGMSSKWCDVVDMVLLKCFVVHVESTLLLF